MIEIIQAVRAQDEMLKELRWICWLELSQDGETWWLPATAPGDLAEGDLLAYFEAQETELWQLAQRKQYQPDVHEHIQAKRVLRAFALVVLDEINILRSELGLEPRTADQIRQAIKNRL